jgi:hypothetical protein
MERSCHPPLLHARGSIFDSTSCVGDGSIDAMSILINLGRVAIAIALAEVVVAAFGGPRSEGGIQFARRQPRLPTSRNQRVVVGVCLPVLLTKMQFLCHIFTGAAFVVHDSPNLHMIRELRRSR